MNNEINFEECEELIRRKEFNELTDQEKVVISALYSHEEYNRLHSMFLSLHNVERVEIDPRKDTKSSLNKALQLESRKRTFFLNRKISLYQSAAAALIFFFIGSALSYIRESPVRIVENTHNVIKYVDRPVKETKYIIVKEKQTDRNEYSSATMPDHILNTNIQPMNSQSEQSVTEFLPDIATVNIEKVMNETNGESLGSDSVLQKMMVTIY